MIGMDSRIIMLAARVACDFKGQMSGGRADGKSIGDFDPKQLLTGALVELEHTDDMMLAIETAMDHLSEFDDYYVELKKMEKKLESRKAVDTELKKTRKIPDGRFYKYTDSAGNDFFVQTKEKKMYSPFTREGVTDPVPVNPSDMRNEITEERETKKESNRR